MIEKIFPGLGGVSGVLCVCGCDCNTVFSHFVDILEDVIGEGPNPNPEPD